MATTCGYAAFGRRGALYGFFDDDIDYAESQAPPDGVVVRALYYSYGGGEMSAYIPTMKTACAVTQLRRRPAAMKRDDDSSSDDRSSSSSERTKRRRPPRPPGYAVIRGQKELELPTHEEMLQWVLEDEDAEANARNWQ